MYEDHGQKKRERKTMKCVFIHYVFQAKPLKTFLVLYRIGVILGWKLYCVLDGVEGKITNPT